MTRVRWLLLTVALVAAFIAVVDLSDRRRSTRALRDDYLTQLFGGEGGMALLEHPRQVTSWRVAGPPGRAVLPDAQSVTLLVALLRDSASYIHGGAALPRAFEVAVRFEDELGSMTLFFTRAGSALRVLRDGSPLGEADTSPVQGRLGRLLGRVLGEPVGAAAR